MGTGRRTSTVDNTESICFDSNELVCLKLIKTQFSLTEQVVDRNEFHLWRTFRRLRDRPSPFYEPRSQVGMRLYELHEEEGVMN